MAVQNIILYGDVTRLFDAETYATNQDPESFSATLSDATTLADAQIQDTIKALAEAIVTAETWIADGGKVLSDSATLAETFVKSLDMATLVESLSLSDAQAISAEKALTDLIAVADTIATMSAVKPLSDAMTMTESRLIAAIKVLSDAMVVVDSSVQIAQIKGFSEFVRVTDWLELKLQRAGIWSVTPAFGVISSDIHLYGPGVYYGVDYYAANPRVNWLLSTPAAATWQSTEAATEGETLYADTLYSQSLYGSVPAVGWTKPDEMGQQAWTNQNGESHN
jgi:hypothetical protein